MKSRDVAVSSVGDHLVERRSTSCSLRLYSVELGKHDILQFGSEQIVTTKKLWILQNWKPARGYWINHDQTIKLICLFGNDDQLASAFLGSSSERRSSHQVSFSLHPNTYHPIKSIVIEIDSHYYQVMILMQADQKWFEDSSWYKKWSSSDGWRLHPRQCQVGLKILPEINDH